MSKKSLMERIRSTGLPLEQRAFEALSRGLKANWIEAGYEFPVLNESGLTIQRSVDFVLSKSRLNTVPARNGISVYFVIECKQSGRGQDTWLFARESSHVPFSDHVFHDWHPMIWQSEKPSEPFKAPKFPLRRRPRKLDGFFRCFRAAPIAGDEVKREGHLPAIESALHQVRDCIHDLLINRGWLLIREFKKIGALVFVPVILTNASLRVLRPDFDKLPTDANGQEDLNRLSTAHEELLLRVPKNFSQVDWKYDRLMNNLPAHRIYLFEPGLPGYVNEGSLRVHFRRFFENVPRYAMVTSLERFPRVAQRIMKWVNSLRFPTVEAGFSNADGGTADDTPPPAPPPPPVG